MIRNKRLLIFVSPAGDYRVHPNIALLWLHLCYRLHILDSHWNCWIFRCLLVYQKNIRRYQDRLSSECDRTWSVPPGLPRILESLTPRPDWPDHDTVMGMNQFKVVDFCSALGTLSYHCSSFQNIYIKVKKKSNCSSPVCHGEKLSANMLTWKIDLL